MKSGVKKMGLICMIWEILWNWSRTVFGTIFVACMLMSLVLLAVELGIYRVKRKRAAQEERTEAKEKKGETK